MGNRDRCLPGTIYFFRTRAVQRTIVPFYPFVSLLFSFLFVHPRTLLLFLLSMDQDEGESKRNYGGINGNSRRRSRHSTRLRKFHLHPPRAGDSSRYPKTVYTTSRY